MKRLELADIPMEDLECISFGENLLFRIPNGNVLKLFSKRYLENYETYTGFRLEDKILAADGKDFHTSVVAPKGIVYADGVFSGCVMDEVDGVSIQEFCSQLPEEEQFDLHMFAHLYSAIEKPILKEERLVFPDLCTDGNVLVKQNDSSFSVNYIDYDGIQVDSYPSLVIAFSLGLPKQFYNSKYLSTASDTLFNKELDKRSLIHLYFSSAFHFELDCIGQPHPLYLRPTTIHDVFQFLGIEDEIFRNKVEKAFSSDQNNEYLADDVFRLADNYQLEMVSNPFEPGTIAKVLKKVS